MSTVQRIQKVSHDNGQSLVELLLAIGLAAILLPAVLVGLVSSRNGKVQQYHRQDASNVLKGTVDSLRTIRETAGWQTFSTDGTFHIVQGASTWTLAAGPFTDSNGFTSQVVISDVYRDQTTQNIVATGASGSVLDPSVKQVVTTVSWTQPTPSSVQSTLYMTRYLDNLTFTQTTLADFTPGIFNNTQKQNVSGGEVILANNNYAKWCTPAFSSSTIDLDDGPPVAVSATASATTTTVPNDVFVATAPSDATQIKLDYVQVTANGSTPVPTIIGNFTLDPSLYSSPSYVPTGINLTNSFKTNDVKYYRSVANRLYALMATNVADHEVIAIEINDGTSNTFQDPVNHIYKYWTFFNTKIYGTAYSNPSANAAETSNAGDNDGYQTNPANANVNDGLFATDTNSGSATGVNCTGNDKDKHRYYNYGFSIPSGATINGIGINLAAKVDSVTGTPKMCVQLSWDGGATWTSAKTSSALTTSVATYTLGGAADTWGRTWSSTNFTNANFRVRIIDIASNTSRDFSLDWLGVKVYYNGIASIPNDQAPFGYGATALTIMGNTGYVDSGGYLYTFDLSNIDSKSPTSELDQVGCRILLDGYDCQPGSGTDKKYIAGETGASWSDTTAPAHNDCTDGGNVELNADRQLSAVQVGANKYVYTAVGAGTNPELDVVDVSTAPTVNISNSSCGRGSDTGWKVTGTLDLNPTSGEEAANSVYAKSDGTRAYISSNGGIIHNGIPDSDQFYVIDTTNKSAPKFLTTWPTTVNGQHYANTASSGYYNGNATNIQLYPRRALTVLNGKRAVIVGQDGIPDGTEPQEYQVINVDPNDPAGNLESAPAYCGGLNFASGFNDLTSVSEADGDNFVYMVANTTDHNLKIIQGGPDVGIYTDSGNFQAATFSASLATSFNRFTATIAQPGNSTIKMQVGVAPPDGLGTCNNPTYTFVGPNGDPLQYFTPVGSIISGVVPFGNYSTNYQNPGRCVSYKTWLTASSDYTQTPTLYDMTVNYSP